MINFVAILMGILFFVVFFGLLYIIRGILRFFGLDAQEVITTIIGFAIILIVMWIIGTIALEVLGII